MHEAGVTRSKALDELRLVLTPKKIDKREIAFVGDKGSRCHDKRNNKTSKITTDTW